MDNGLNLRWISSALGFFCISSLLYCISIRAATGPNTKRTDRKPRTLPYVFPVLKNTVPFLFDGLNFFLEAARFNLEQPAMRIALLKDDIYLVQGPKYMAQVLRAPSLTVTQAHAIALKCCFGTSQDAADVYAADTSGSQFKPIEGSDVSCQNRVSYLTHENLTKGLLGSGLAPATNRFEIALTESLCSENIDQDWIYYPDFLEFYENHVGTAIIKALFGSELLRQNPGFYHDFWAYDKVIMKLAQRIPIFWIPNAYRIRKKLLMSIKRWHEFARERSMTEGNIQQGDDDPFWGSEMVRERHKMLLNIGSQDYDSVAATDLGLIWATLTNVVPSSMTLALHLFRDLSSLSEIRLCVAESIKPHAQDKLDLAKLEQHPLLLSMYAETLRFGVQIHVPRYSPYQDIRINNFLIPKKKLILINTWQAHTNESAWNTKQGAFPLDHFWAQRFLIDSRDPTSGPTKPKNPSPGNHAAPNNDAERVRFSTEGLEGAWIPYGGGHHACPGRLLAKRIMLLSCATMVSMFDVEILADEKALEYGSPRFGFGVRKPKGSVAFRIRKVREEGLVK